MNRTRLIFFAVIGVALVVVVASIGLRQAGVRTPIVQAPAAVEVRVVTALPVEPFVSRAAEQYNAGGHKIEGHPVHVSVVPMDGLTAMGRWERDEMDPIPTA